MRSDKMLSTLQPDAPMWLHKFTHCHDKQINSDTLAGTHKVDVDLNKSDFIPPG